MANSHQANAFVSSFVQGFSFVDDMNSRKRQEKKLDERLKAEEEQRKFQRSRLTQIDAERGADRATAELDRQRVARERELARAGKLVALDPNASREDLMTAALHSPEAFNRAATEFGRDQLVEAMKASRGPLASTTSTQPGLNAAAAAQAGQSAVDPATGRPVDSLLAPSRGRDSLQEVDIDDINDPDAPKGFRGIPGMVKESFEGAGNRISGGALGLVQGVANLGISAGNAITGQDAPPLQAATGLDFGAEIGNNIAVPAAYTTPEEFESLQDPAAIEQAAQTNAEIIKQVKQRGIETSSRDLDRLDQLRQGSREQRAIAAEAENTVLSYYDGVEDPNEPNQWRAMAADDPQAAAIKYFNDRNTLISADPNRAAAMDMAVQSVVRQASAEITQQLGNSVIGSPEYARGQRDLRQLQASQTDILRDYSPSKQAGIDDRGLPIGNAKLSQQLLNAVDDPNRPRPIAPMPGRQVHTAAVMTNRMAGARRATDAQLRAGIMMVDAKLASSQDLMVLNMTGSWPSTTPAAKTITGRPGDHIFTANSDGSLKLAYVVPDKSSRPSRTGPSNDLNQVTPGVMSQFTAGVQTLYPSGVDGNDEFIRAMEGLMLDSSDMLQETFDLRDPIAGHLLGRSFAAAFSISEAEDSPWLPNWLEEAPTMQEILASPELAARLAVEHDIPMPRVLVPRMDGVNVNNMREEILTPLKYRPVLQEAAETQDDEAFVETIARYDYEVNGQ